MKSVLTLLIVPFVFCGFWGCRKSNDGPAGYTGCRISSVLETTGNGNSKTTYTFLYNNDGTVSSIRATNAISHADEFVREFVYGPGYVRIGIFSPGTQSPVGLEIEDSLVLDGRKRVTDIYTDSRQTEQRRPQYHFEYDVLGQVATSSQIYSNQELSDTFQYLNGDNLYYTQADRDTGSGILFSRSSCSCTYDSGLYNVGNIHAVIEDFENYGMTIHTVNHRLTKEYASFSAATFYYGYAIDNKGYITQISTADQNGVKATTDITYACE